jgi:gamma-glutamylcyclotransferase (GGCT)/AIG2-like uncharacterized protein YtfP
MTEYLFVYGTLRPEEAPEEIRAVVARLRPAGEGTVPGIIFDLGEYPGAVIDPGSGQRIHGMVFELPADESVFGPMDGYEGFSPEDLAGSLFLRVKERVELDAGGSVEAWVYVYNLPPAGAPVVASGRWLRRGERTETA